MTQGEDREAQRPDQLNGTVRNVELGVVMAEVTVDVAGHGGA